jgi:hypothetical protein
MPEPVRQEPPSSVKTAVKLMYAGAVINALSLIISLATVGSLKSTLHKAAPSLTPSQLHSYEVFFVTITVVSGVIGIGLWVWMARANQAGKSWARITGTVFFGIYTLLLLLGIARAGAAASTLVSILTWLIGLGTVILLWRRESSAYFSAPQWPAGTPGGMPPYGGAPPMN